MIVNEVFKGLPVAFGRLVRQYAIDHDDFQLRGTDPYEMPLDLPHFVLDFYRDPTAAYFGLSLVCKLRADRRPSGDSQLFGTWPDEAEGITAWWLAVLERLRADGLIATGDAAGPGDQVTKEAGAGGGKATRGPTGDTKRKLQLLYQLREDAITTGHQIPFFTAACDQADNLDYETATRWIPQRLRDDWDKRQHWKFADFAELYELRYELPNDET